MIILAATPIGNLGDASPRLRTALAHADVIAAEDTRTAQKLLRALHVDARPRLVALHDHNEKQKAGEVAELGRDADVLVISDAGMPTVSDPGYGLVGEAAARGIPVTVIPGPSAVVTALAVSGLPTDRFTFEGFVPRRPGERRAALDALRDQPRTMVFFEAPTRAAATLADMAAVFGAERPAAVCRELTKLHEEIVRARLSELVTWSQAGVRGELVLVVGGASPRRVALADALAQVLELTRGGVRMKDAAAEVAGLTGRSGRELYQAALAARNR